MITTLFNGHRQPRYFTGRTVLKLKSNQFAIRFVKYMCYNINYKIFNINLLKLILTQKLIYKFNNKLNFNAFI